jgi:hypothetical protein
MDPGVFIPLAVFAVVVLIVSITSVTKLRDNEVEVHQRLYREQLEHQRKMKELALELEGVKHIAQSLSLPVSQSIGAASKAMSD